MLEKDALYRMEQASHSSFTSAQLTDISQISVDVGQPVYRRIDRFVSQVGNPYVFRVGDALVRLTFDSDAPSLSTRIAEAARLS